MESPAQTEKECNAEFPSLTTEVRNFLKKHAHLLTNLQELHQKPDVIKQANDYYAKLRLLAYKLLRHGGEIRGMKTLTLLFEELGLMIKKNNEEFFTKRETLATYAPDSPLAVEELQITTAIAVRFVVGRRRLTNEGLILLPDNRNTDFLYVGFNDTSQCNPEDPLRLGWLGHISWDELRAKSEKKVDRAIQRVFESGKDPEIERDAEKKRLKKSGEDLKKRGNDLEMGYREREIEKQMQGMRWRGHEGLDHCQKKGRKGGFSRASHGELTLVADLDDSGLVAEGMRAKFSNTFGLAIDFSNLNAKDGAENNRRLGVQVAENRIMLAEIIRATIAGELQGFVHGGRPLQCQLQS